MQHCIGGRVNVLSDYKKTEPPKILKNFHSKCHHLIDMLGPMVEACSSRVLPVIV